MATASPLKLRVEGMDCAACATKIESALQRLPDVSDVAVSYGQESLSLLVDEDRTSRATIEGRIRALGFMPVGGEARGKAANADRKPAQAWWRTPRGRLERGPGGSQILLQDLIELFQPAVHGARA